MITIQKSPRLQQEIDEHLELWEMLFQVQTVVSERTLPKHEVRLLVRQLGDHLLSHFDHEEAEDGCFEEALKLAPRLRSNACQLLREHFDLRLQYFTVEHYAMRAQREAADWWAGLESRLSEFVQRFIAHESAENDLLHAAYCEDLGGPG